MSIDSKSTVKKTLVRAWDVHIRLFHWALVILVLNAWLTAEFGDMEMRWHKWNGYAIFFLLVFRLLWGVLGSNTARLSRLVYRPSKIFSYIRGLVSLRPPKYLAHNPLGALMVMLMLTALLLQVVSGLFASDGLFAAGPLANLIVESRAEDFALVHELIFYFILLLVALHIGAILLYLFILKDNLITPMFSGNKPAQEFLDTPYQKKGGPKRLVFCVALALAFVASIITGFDLTILIDVLLY